MTRAALFVVTLAAATTAGAQTAVPTIDRSEVLIEYTGPTQISNDFMVMHIRIVNRTGRARTWSFQFEALESSYVEIGHRSRFELEVEDGADRQFEILIPLSETSISSWLQMSVFGHGLSNPGRVDVLAGTIRSRVAVSANATLKSPGLREKLTEDPGGSGGGTLAAATLTSDWRAYSGLAALWLSGEEWTSARPAVRRAVTAWVETGGRLYLVEPGDEPSPSPVERRGLGFIATVPDGLEASDASLFSFQLPPVANPGESLSWVSSLIEPIETNKGLLSLFLLGYLVLAGPVNLLVLAPGNKRMRLFWTMPAIALGASALMGAVILLQDGVGGAGYRASLVYLEPGLNRELVFQDQVSRTGALYTRSFEIDETVVMRALATDALPHQKPSMVTTSGSHYSGDWFRSRSVQAQSLVASRSSRARIELVDSDGSAPTILSSIEVPLEKLFYTDALGRIWYGENVLPGRPVELAPSTTTAYEEFYFRACFTIAGPSIRRYAGEVRTLSGAFLAAASGEPSGVAIETLHAIDWDDAPVLYAGHIGGRR